MDPGCAAGEQRAEPGSRSVTRQCLPPLLLLREVVPPSRQTLRHQDPQPGAARRWERVGAHLGRGGSNGGGTPGSGACLHGAANPQGAPWMAEA